MSDRNHERKQRYRQDQDYANQQRQASRDTYRKDHPLGPPKAREALHVNGQIREVYTESMDHPVSVETFTVPEAARALGRSELTFKRWLEDDLVPEPILRDTVRGYRHYSVGELRVIARVLVEHERESAYYTTRNELTRQTLMQAVHAYRAQRI